MNKATTWFAATSTTRVYTVTVNASAPVGTVTPANLLCSTPGGGYANTATLYAGTRVTTLGSAPACAPISVAPLEIWPVTEQGS